MQVGLPQFAKMESAGLFTKKVTMRSQFLDTVAIRPSWWCALLLQPDVLYLPFSQDYDCHHVDHCILVCFMSAC